MEKLFAGDGEVKVGSDVMDLETRLSVIRALIPLGLEAVADVLQQEVEQLAGVRYARKGSEQSHRRWGSQKGSVYLMDQKLPVAVPRVRDVESDTEVSLAAYRGMQRPRAMDEKLLLRVLKGISCRNYRACAESVPEAFGISASSVSRRFIKATAKKLKQFQERPLDDYDLVALFIDGKSFADEEIVIAPGVTTDGQKIPLGFVESATENERICRQLIQDLIRRGLCYDQGLLVVLDGSKGLRSAVTKALKGDVCVHRCQWHKRENVVSYLPEAERPRVRRKLQKAYDCDTYEEAKAALESLKPELKLMNQSAVASLEEEAIEQAFGGACDFAQLVKQYGTDPDADRTYSPAKCIGIDVRPVVGNPDPAHISTSYIERSNLTMRMGNRRFTRLTNGFSKKWINHAHAIALHMFYYNFCRKHKTLKGRTPAMAAGLTDRAWSVTDLVKLLEDEERKLMKGGRINREDRS